MIQVMLTVHYQKCIDGLQININFLTNILIVSTAWNALKEDD
jgi:hypothetical protein